MKQTLLKLLGATSLSVAWSGVLFAGDQTFTFDSNPATDPTLTGALIVGTHNYANAYGNSQIWSSGAGAAVNGNGNPASSGYLSLADGTNINNNLVFVFPDVDSGLPLANFFISMDIRCGVGTVGGGRPADGYSVSFARAGDVALVNATNNVVNGFAGGDGGYAPAQSPLGSTDVENGTKTGVAIVFDAWQGNWLPDTTQINGTSGSSDREGIAVRVDDHTYIQLNLQNNRNERDACCGAPIQTNLQNSFGGLSIQTGTNAVVTTYTGTPCPGSVLPGLPSVYGNTDTSGAFTNLCWQPLEIKLTNDTSPAHLLVHWKNVLVVDTNLGTYAPTIGRLVLASRTGGNSESVHADNIHVLTFPTTQTYISQVKGLFNGFVLTLSDNGPLTVSSVQSILLDTNNPAINTNVTAYTANNYAAPFTTLTYTQAIKFPPNSQHIVTTTWKDSANNSQTFTIGFTIPNYSTFPTNFVLPLSAVDSTRVGLYVKPWQWRHANPNQMWWTDEAFLGYHGTNIVGTIGLTIPSEAGVFYYDGPLGFIGTGSGATPFFSGDTDLGTFGIGQIPPSGFSFNVRYATYDNSGLEMYGYVYFPTSGVYNMVIGSDDSFQLSVGADPRDRLGQVVWFNNGSRVPTLGGTTPSPPTIADIRPVLVDAPGVYPIRLTWENGGGGAAFEWYYCQFPDGNSTPFNGAFLVNDTNNIATAASQGVAVILTYRAASGSVPTGPWVSKVNPVRNAQDVVYYCPMVVDLTDGSSAGTAVDGTTISFYNYFVNTNLAYVTNNFPFSKTKVGNVTQLRETDTPAWFSGLYTNVLTFNDINGKSYAYSWNFSVIGGLIGGVAAADVTNSPITFKLTGMMPLGSVDTTKPGFRVKSFQGTTEGPNHSGWSEEQLEGLHEEDISDKSTANVSPGVWSWNNLFDFRDSFTGAGVLTTGAGGEWNYDLSDLTQFGIGTPAVQTHVPFLQHTNNKAQESSTLDIGAWLYFPTAGNYIMHINTDDGFRLQNPLGSLFGKLSTLPLNYILAADVGRGMAGASGGVQGGGNYIPFTVPAAGAYPFRLIYFNGGTDAGIEWSIYQKMGDGSVFRIPVNDVDTDFTGYIPGTSTIKAYQALSAGDVWGPYVSYVNPVPNAQDIFRWQPIVIELTDGGGKTVNGSSPVLKVDGAPVTVSVTAPSLGVTRISTAYNGAAPLGSGNHTNVLTWADNTATSYTNTWTFSVMSQTPAAITTLTNGVPLAAVDTTQPGFRVMAYQTINGIGNIDPAERTFLGLNGPNIATNVPGGVPPAYFVFNNSLDFVDNAGYPSGSGEYRYNYSFSNYFGFITNGGGANENNVTLKFAGWLYFPQAGLYMMTVNSDDGFKLSSPAGINPFSEAGQAISWFDGGRGNSGANANPLAGGSVTPGVFYIPTAGAYPIRLLWWNGGGGLNLEWTVWEYQANGTLRRELLGDADSAIKIYQTLTNPPTPFVLAVLPTPNNVAGGAPQLNFGPGNGSTTPVPVQQDYNFLLQDGASSVNTNTIQLWLNGYMQPIIVTNPAPGISQITRQAANATFWPSGQFGPLLVTYQDMAGNSYTQFVENVTTPFWGTLSNRYYALGTGDTNKFGFKLRTYQVDPGFGPKTTNTITVGTLTIPNRIHVAEQILAGMWGPNVANVAALTDGGYADILGTNNISGLINFNAQVPGQAGDFQSPAYPDQQFPSLPGLGPTVINNDRSNSVAMEIRAYVEFPTNGTYIMGVASDDGFRLTHNLTNDFTPPLHLGALIVNSPGGVAGSKATCQNGSFIPINSLPITNPITGNLVLVQGLGYGSSNANEGCSIANAGALAGNIALMYRPIGGNCSAQQQVDNAYQAGARAVVFVRNPSTTNGWFPQEEGIGTPLMPIPAVEISKDDGDALSANLPSPGVNVTITTFDYTVNPPPAESPLGEADQGKGANDILFPVVVNNPGIYPLRLVYWNGGGGVNCEWFTLTVSSVTGTNRTLLNDHTATNGPSLTGTGLNAFAGLGGLYATTDGVNISIHFNPNSILQSSPDNITWTDVTPAPANPLVIPIGSAGAEKFYRTRVVEIP